MIRAAASRGIPVLAGGPDATDHAASYLGYGASVVIRGEADPRLSDFPVEMREGELRLMARVLRAGKLDAPVASAEDVQTWAGKFVGAHPELGPGLSIFELPTPTSEQAADICRANIGVMKGLAEEAPAERARLFRGTLSEG